MCIVAIYNYKLYNHHMRQYLKIFHLIATSLIIYSFLHIIKYDILYFFTINIIRNIFTSYLVFWVAKYAIYIYIAVLHPIFLTVSTRTALAQLIFRSYFFPEPPWKSTLIEWIKCILMTLTDNALMYIKQ